MWNYQMIVVTTIYYKFTHLFHYPYFVQILPLHNAPKNTNLYLILYKSVKLKQLLLNGKQFHRARIADGGKKESIE